MTLTELKKATAAKPSNEQRYFDALKRIAAYTQPERMKRDEMAGRGYGLDPDEAVEMAYENVLEEAKRAVRGKRRPKS